MRNSMALFAALLFVASSHPEPPATEPKDGWIDLLKNGLDDWKRIALPLGTKLNAENPWKYDAAKKTLTCSKPGFFEMLLHKKEFGDGIYHVEWRFHKVEGKNDYNSGIYVRCAADGTIWHQAQVAQTQKPPHYADLFGVTKVGDKLEKFLKTGDGAKFVRPPGEWNTYEIVCQGKNITVWVNGKKATDWRQCQIASGLVGVQAEYFVIEFRNLKFRPAK
ncbi:MAG: hypothetical protein KatS3mg105_4742 [Gemmatales bacterium]|nr:MAG: hypothetical protein KatS3mg105_4742 [Gemmatales bacterium]